MSHNLRSLAVVFTHFIALMVAVGCLPSISKPASAALPDLTVQSFSVKPREVKAGDLLTISVTVKNTGTKRAPSSWVALFGTTEAARDLIDAMGPVSLNGGPLARNATATVIFRITVPSVTPGVYAIYAKVDPERLVSESREKNNVIALGKVTLRSQADLSVPSFSVAPSAVTAGDVLTVTATVKNIGTKRAPSSWVALFGTTATATDLAEAMGPASLDGGPLAPNASATVTFSITVPALTPGEYAIYAKVDPNQLVAESRESNNISAFGTVTLNPPHPPPPSAGTSYYVATGGSDGNPGTDALPFRTISYAVSRLAPGETLLVKNGTYAESLDDNIPAGTSWSQPVTVAAYPGHTVVLRPNPGAGWVLHFSGPQAYIIIDGVILDGSNVTYDVVKITDGPDGTPAHHIRLQNCEVMNSPDGHGILISGNDSGYNEILDCKIHHNGNQYGGGSSNHGLYVQTNYNLIEGNEIYDHHFGYGIHVFNGSLSFNQILRNRVHDNVDGMDIHGDGNLVALNLVWNCGIGINLGPSGSVLGGNEIVHNTMYRCGAGVSVRAGVPSAKILNNIVQASSGYPSNSIIDNGINTQIEHNVLDRSMYKYEPIFVELPAGTNLYNTNALFVNPVGFDFHLQSASPAKGAGMDLPDVPTDFDEVTWGDPRSSGAFR